MQAPNIPPDESQRLAALRLLDLLDTPAEERFDRITRIAQQLFNVPITLISLIDSERQWFKSRQGLDATETPREISFCGHAILYDEIFEVPDARADPRFADNPLVTGPPDLRFYAGAPLSTLDGHRVGTLCLIDRNPRRLSVNEHHLLRDMRELVMAEFGRGRLQEAVDALRSHEARMRAIFNTATDGIITIAEDGIIESFNPAATGIFGYTPEEVIGSNVSRLMPEPQCSRHDGYILRFLTTAEPRAIGRRLEMSGRHRSGATFPMELAVSETMVGGRRFFTGIIRDISERKEAERIKKEFISTISHELRTPLTSIRGSLGLIAGGAAGTLPPQASRLIEVAHRNSERLVRLINDILDIDKIELGKMKFDLQTQPLLPLVRQAIEANRSYAREFGVEIALVGNESDASVHVDADRLNQAITNLLSNAAKFSPSGTTVEVTIKRRDDKLRLAIADHGPGVPEQFRERIFEKFSQADASDTRRKGGTGLGLAITKSLIEAMNGRIGYDSGGSGATFWFELPAMPTTDSRTSEGTRRILICENDPDIAAQIRQMLTHDGDQADGTIGTANTAQTDDVPPRRRILHIEDDADVHRFISTLATELADFDHAPDLNAARQLLATHAYDLVILDLALPDGSGLDILPLISRQTSPPRVVVFSASDISRHDERQFAACLVKSTTDNPTLLATLRAQIGIPPAAEDHR
jgi:PAS domain S-box-containing protein